MRLNEAVKSPHRSWLIAKDLSEKPIDATATPIIKPDGEVIGGIVVFQDPTVRITTEVGLWERNQDLEAFQLKLIVTTPSQDSRTPTSDRLYWALGLLTDDCMDGSQRNRFPI